MGVMGDRVAELEARIEKLEKAVADLPKTGTATAPKTAAVTGTAPVVEKK